MSAVENRRVEYRSLFSPGMSPTSKLARWGLRQTASGPVESPSKSIYCTVLMLTGDVRNALHLRVGTRKKIAVIFRTQRRTNFNLQTSVERAVEPREGLPSRNRGDLESWPGERRFLGIWRDASFGSVATPKKVPNHRVGNSGGSKDFYFYSPHWRVRTRAHAITCVLALWP